MDVKNQDELNMKAIFVNKESTETYYDSAERKDVWQSLIEKQ
jgi:hypothetical protein